MSWKVPEYSKTKIIKAGKVIRDSEDDTTPEVQAAIRVVDNWRASHAFPLQVIYCHLKRSYDAPDYIVAQRLKRLDSIMKKLRREPTMSLWTMQDLGGCRVVVPTVEDVYRVAKTYKKSRVRHICKNEYDYLQEPKPSGYRSYHMVYQYQSDTKDTYNRNMLIEIQIRTHLQHLWATALETMGLFTNQALKAGLGEEDVLRFFKLISSAFAIVEGLPTVPDTPGEMTNIIAEIEALDKEHNYLSMLSAIRVAVDHFEFKDRRQRGYYILILNYATRRLRLRFYKPGQIDSATKAYNDIEKTRAADKVDAVLVSVSSFNTLKSAYPNYFSDIGAFVEKVDEILQK